MNAATALLREVKKMPRGRIAREVVAQPEVISTQDIPKVCPEHSKLEYQLGALNRRVAWLIAVIALLGSIGLFFLGALTYKFGGMAKVLETIASKLG